MRVSRSRAAWISPPDPEQTYTRFFTPLGTYSALSDEKPWRARARSRSRSRGEIAELYRRSPTSRCSPPSEAILRRGQLLGAARGSPGYRRSFICGDRPDVGPDLGDAAGRRFLRLPSERPIPPGEADAPLGARDSTVDIAAFRRDTRNWFPVTRDLMRARRRWNRPGRGKTC